MLVNRVVSYIVNTLKFQETTSRKVIQPYRKFKVPNTDESLFVTDIAVYIGQTFNNCRPARSVVVAAHQKN